MWGCKRRQPDGNLKEAAIFRGVFPLIIRAVYDELSLICGQLAGMYSGLKEPDERTSGDDFMLLECFECGHMSL